MRRDTNQPSKGLVGFVLLIWVVVTLSGCESIERTIKEHPKTAIGAGAGGAGGAIVGGLAGATKGAIIGGLVGVLAGGIIGNLLDRQERPRDDTAKTVAYTEDQGNLVRIEEVDINPASIRAGETLNVNIRYAVMTPRGSAPARIREVRQIYFQDALVGNPVVEINRPDGTYWSTLPITLPATAASGHYDVIVAVEMDGTLDRWESRFLVARQ